MCIGLHKPHTTSCSASSFCCYHRRALKKPTKYGSPRGNCCAMWANIRQSDSSHSTDWRDDPPQEVRALPQNFLHHAQTSNFILWHLLVSFADSFEGSLRRLSFLPVSFLKVLLTTILHCKVAATHQLRSTVCILVFPRRVRWSLSCSNPFKSKILPHSAQKYCSFTITFQILPRCAFCSTPLHCHNFSG